MNHHSPRLIDDNDIGILIDNVQRNIFGHNLDSLWLGHLHKDLLACCQLIVFLHWFFGCQADIPLFDPVLHHAACHTGQPFGEIGVDPFPASSSPTQNTCSVMSLHRLIVLNEVIIKEQQHTDHDINIRDIEHRKMDKPEIEEIDDKAMPCAVNQIADCPGCNQV